MTKKLDLAFDIGGYNGGYTAWLLQQGYKRIVTIEPNPNSFRQLQERFKNESRVILKNCAISNKENFQLFYVSSKHPTLCTLEDKFVTQSRFSKQADENRIPYEWDSEITVECLTLETLIKRFDLPDWIKVDVEGHELEVLRTMPKMHSLPKTVEVTFEVTEEFIENTERCIANLYNKGFYEFGLIDNDQPESYPKKFYTFVEFTKKLELAFPSENKQFFGMAFAKTPNI